MAIILRELAAPLAVGDPVAGGFRVAAFDERDATIVLEPQAGGRRLVVRLEPRDDERPRFEATPTLNVSYASGAGEPLSRPERRALLALVRVLRRNDRGEPLETPPQARGRAVAPAPSPGGRIVAGLSGERAILRVGSTCEMSCIFCTRGEGGSFPKPRPLSSREELVGALEKIARARVGSLVIGGDEPLAHPDLPALVAMARERGIGQVHLQTSGLGLRDRVLAESLVRLGVVRFLLPVYGPSAEIHDAITRLPGSFEALNAAVDVVRSLGAEVLGNGLLLRQNLAHLPDTLSFARRRFGLRTLAFGHVMARSGDIDDYRAKMPPYSEIVRALRGSRVELVGFPLCVARQVRPGRRARTSAGGFANPDQPFEWRVKPDPCRGCAWEPRCPGTYAKHLEAYGTDGLEARPRPPRRPGGAAPTARRRTGRAVP